MSDLDRLMRFAYVAEELSFSEAARRLHVDQPWLSRQIQQLEAQLDFALFTRSTRKVELTKEGEELFVHARELARAAKGCREAAREMMRSRNAQLSIGVNPFTYWLPERRAILDSFQERHSRVSIEIVSNYTPRLLSKLRKRMIDIALVAQPFDYPDFETLVIHSSPVSLLVPPEDALAGRKRVKLAELAGRRMPVTNPDLNASLSQLLYGPIFEAGVIPLIVPEGAPAIAFYAASERLPVPVIGWPHSGQSDLPDFVHVEIEPPVPLARFALLRRREPPRALLDHFWNAAAKLVGDQAWADVPQSPAPTYSVRAETPLRIAVG
jgi:DNA-binding transcriptional LysR family regulator